MEMMIQTMKMILLGCSIFAGSCMVASAQQDATITTNPAPLVLKAQGSFYLGGERERQTTEELGGICPSGHVTVNQMYVRYMIPWNQTDSISFVLIHGMHLSGKCWETTPDGRMGWDEYLTRKGHAVYVVDQVGIGRSGFNQKIYNDVRAGKVEPINQIPFSRKTDENSWTNFRFGTKDGTPVQEAQFPVASLDEFSKQNLPHIMRLPSPDANYRCLSELSVKAKDAVLVAILNQALSLLKRFCIIRKVSEAWFFSNRVEPGRGYSDEQIKKLVNIPLLIIFGDNLTNETGMPGHVWQNSLNGWNRLAEAINRIGGNATVIHLPDRGIHGNSHMLMMDKNSHQIAEIMLDWCKKNVIRKGNDN